MDGKPANRSEEITDEEWLTVNEFNRDMVEDYLNNQVHLSPKSLIAYRSALRIFFVWVKNNLHDKDCTEIRKKEFLRYLNWLAVRGFSESGIKFKKSSVSTFNKLLKIFTKTIIRNFAIMLLPRCKFQKQERFMQKNH